jgi:hypothetical protein
MKVRRSEILYRTNDCPEDADRVSQNLLVNSERAKILVGVNTVNDKLYLIQLFSGSEHGTLGYSFNLGGGWEEVFWLAADASGFAQEFSKAYPRISLCGSMPAESLQDFMRTAFDAGYDTDLGVWNWDDATETLRSLVVSSGGTLLDE